MAGTPRDPRWSRRLKLRRPGRTGCNRRRPALEPLEAYTLLSADFPVEMNSDDGLGDVMFTLSWAIDQVNNDTTDTSADRDAISFDIGGGGAQTIAPTSALPTLSRPALIDGTTQPGGNGAPGPLVQISGSAVTGSATGLTLGPGSGGSTVLGLAISGFGGDGIDVLSDGNTVGGSAAGAGNAIGGNKLVGIALKAGVSDNLLLGNLIGTGTSGGTGLRNGASGVAIEAGASSNTIGGTSAGAGNIIAENKGAGVVIAGPASGQPGPDTTNNLVLGNTIASNGGNGVQIVDGATGNTIGGTSALVEIGGTNPVANTIVGNGGDGVDLIGDGVASNQVLGNFIGTDAAGDTRMGNIGIGVFIETNSTGGNTIGGTSGGAGNIIASNGFAPDGNPISGYGGVEVIGGAGFRTSGTLIAGNLIGTDATGATKLGNSSYGVMIDGAAGIVVDDNTIDDNPDDGLVLAGGSGNTVEGNAIEVNGGSGVTIEDGASGNTIGGTASGANNVIVLNTGAGIVISGSASGQPGPRTTDNLVLGNTIGSNGSDGVQIVDGAAGNTIGGTAAFAGNQINNNQGNGVTVGLSPTDVAAGNAILGNSIFGNARLGIDLGDDGVTPNDSVGHTGPNLFQDFPVLSSASTGPGGLTVITGTVEGPASSTLTVQLFSNPAADPSGYGQGETFLGSIPVPIGAAGTGTFSFTTAAPLTTGSTVSATATIFGNTSEFSQDLTTSQPNDDVTDEALVTQGPFIYDRALHLFEQKVTVTPLAGIPGLIWLELYDLPIGVKLQNASMYSSAANPPADSPMALVWPAVGQPEVGVGISVTLEFSDPGNLPVSYSYKVISFNPFAASAFQVRGAGVPAAVAVTVVGRSHSAADPAPSAPRGPIMAPASPAVAVGPRAGLGRVRTPHRREPALSRLLSPGPRPLAAQED